MNVAITALCVAIALLLTLAMAVVIAFGIAVCCERLGIDLLHLSTLNLDAFRSGHNTRVGLSTRDLPNVATDINTPEVGASHLDASPIHGDAASTDTGPARR